MEDFSAPLAVLNPGGKDADQDFPDLAGTPSSATHAPVNFHAFAAATGGSFLSSVESVVSRRMKNVILLLRSDLKVSLRALDALLRAGCNVHIAFKECGLHQVSQSLLRSDNMANFRTLCEKADGAVAVTEDIAEIYRSAGAKKITFIPTPYPVEDARWDFSVAQTDREGIFLGTREFEVPTRQHASAVMLAFSLAAELGISVSVFNEDGFGGKRRLGSFAAGFPGLRLQILEKRKPYPEYLREMARHRIVLQLDGSSVPGQVAGDALLCRIPCVGGNGATERLAFPELTSHGRAISDIRNLARRLLTDDFFYQQQNTQALTLAKANLGFEVVRKRLNRLFSS